MVVSLCGLGARFLCPPGHLCSRVCPRRSRQPAGALAGTFSHSCPHGAAPQMCALHPLCVACQSPHSGGQGLPAELGVPGRSLPAAAQEPNAPLCAPPSPSYSPAVCLTSRTFCPLAPPLVGGPPCSTALHTVGAQSALALLQALVRGTAPRNAPQEPCGRHT